MLSHDEGQHIEGMMALTNKAHHFLNRAQQEAEDELEAIELTTAHVHVGEGLEGGFTLFDQHTLILTTIVSLEELCEKFISNISS
jgi:hypothetical protein